MVIPDDSALATTHPGQGKSTRAVARWGRALLRVATPDDLDALYEVEIACFLGHRFRKDHLDWILRNEKAVTLLDGTKQGKVLGALMLLFEGTACRVLSVAVVPEARRQGIGTKLMVATEDAARERGSSIIRLEVSTQNLGAIEFYRGLGYRTDGVLYGYYSWGEDAYSMTRLVAPSVDAGPTRHDRRR